jgi:hypothetical protein
MKLYAFRIVKSKEAIPFYIRRRKIQQGYASAIIIYCRAMAFSGQISWQQKHMMHVSAFTSGR